MVRQSKVSTKHLSKSKPVSTDQILKDLEGVERMQLLQLTLIKELIKQVKTLRSDRETT